MVYTYTQLINQHCLFDRCALMLMDSTSDKMFIDRIDCVKHKKQEGSKIRDSDTNVSAPVCNENESIDKTSECSRTIILDANVLGIKEEKTDTFVDHIYSVSSAPCKKRKGSNLSPTGTPEKVACKVKKESEVVAFKTFIFPSASRSGKIQNSQLNTSLLVTDIVSQTHKCAKPIAKNDDVIPFKSKSRKTAVSRLKTSARDVETEIAPNLRKSGNSIVNNNSVFRTYSKFSETQVSEPNNLVEDVSNDNGIYSNPEPDEIPVDSVEDGSPIRLDDSINSGNISFAATNSKGIIFLCSGCGKSFNRKDSRRRHVLKYHPSNTALIESLKPPKLFNCEHCFRRFNNQNYFKHHLRREHLGMETKYTCPICKEKHDIKRILSHFEDSHEIKLETEVLYAESYEDFLLWKKDMEIRTRTQFNKRSKGCNKLKEYVVHNFCCHRSGNFVPRDKGKPNRDIKRRGTKKINSFCPASLKVIQHKNGKCVIYFHTTHVGHTNDLEHMKLTKKKKKLLAKRKSLRFSKSEIIKPQGPQKITAVDNDGTKTVINPPINSNYIYLNEDHSNSVLNPAECVETQFTPPKQRSGVKLTYACPICKERFGIKKILGHFEDAHEIELETEVLEAERYADFLVWKKDIENTTRSHFNKKSTCVNKNKDFVVHYFYCHRSGHFTPKRRDSKKINSYCPASLKVMEYKDGKCVVHFQTTHVGHTDDLEHLELTKKRKQQVKKKTSAMSSNSETGELQQVSFVANVCTGTSFNRSIDLENTSMNSAESQLVSPHIVVCSKASELGNVSTTNNSNENSSRLVCYACGKSYNRKNNLRRHIRKHHPTETSLIEALRAPKMYSLNDDCMVCLACGKSFNRRNNFKRHILKFHPNETSLIEPLQTQNIYNCEHCSKRFHNKRKFRCHVRIEHLGIEYKYKCPICREKFDIPLMLPHFEEAHDIKLETDLLEAEAYEDFLMWKEDMERTTRSHFIKKSKGTSKREEYIIHYFYCHRSGNFIHRGKGDRCLKAHGSKKIDSYCPASLKVVLYNDGRCFIKFQKTHVGHTNDVQHLRLTRSERELLARKIAANMPFEAILREIRNTYSGNALSRLHLLRRQDLENVKKNIHKYLKSDSVYILPTNVEYTEMHVAEQSDAVDNLSSETFVCSIVPSVSSDDVQNDTTIVSQSNEPNDTTVVSQSNQPNDTSLVLQSNQPYDTTVAPQSHQSNDTSLTPESAEARCSQQRSSVHIICAPHSLNSGESNNASSNDTTSNTMSFVCTSCSKSFNRKDSLKRHALRYHPSNTTLIESLKAPKLYSCEHCFRRFNNYKNFNYHQRKDHLGIERKYVCPICKEKFDIRNILKHFGNVHDIKLETEGQEVASFKDFLSWKEAMETRTRSHYNKKGKECNKTNDYVIHYFYCHRSGHFIPRGTGHRNLKRQGSTKIDSYCPSSVKCIQYSSGRCYIKFQKTHVGHTNDLEHLRLTKSDKELLAKKISENIPFDEILSEIKDSMSESELSRLHLVRRHDLENIKKSIDAQEAQLVQQQQEEEEESDNTSNVKVERFVCTSCTKSFKRKENLKRHIVKCHASDTSLIESLKTPKLHCCEHCSQTFQSIIKFRKHQRQQHSNLESKFVCPICGERFRFQGILDHFGDIHGVTLENELYEFESYNEFLMWKEDMETRTVCCFPKKSKGHNKSKDFVIHYFYCHRSGHFNPRGVTDRKIKRQGSKKINSYCPASLKLIEYNDGRCSLKFQTTHVGHTNELEHVTLTRTEKELLAMKIAANIPFDVILREIRESIAGSELNRLHLLRRKDLENIKRSYNL